MSLAINLLAIWYIHRRLNDNMLFIKTYTLQCYLFKHTFQLLYFVMVSKDTPKSDKLMILSTISYLVFPIDLVSAKRLPIIGWIDEAFSLSVAFQKVSKNITPEIEWKTDKLLDKWFPEYTKYIEVFD